MRLINCESPRYILSPHTGEMVACRCGVCNSCRNEFAHRWVRRLDDESQAHKYTFMFFLSYDDDHLPSLFFSDDMEELVLNRDESVRIPLQTVFEACKEEGEYDDTSLCYLRDRLCDPLGLPLIYTKDVTNFFKRFNKYCFSHVTHHYENFRYFACHEYGPTTYRPHVHGLMWFDDDAIAARFREILSACWSLGHSDASAVFSHGGKSYVAQYVNMSVHLPTFYKLDFFRQKHQFSKCPPIGSLSILGQTLSDVYERTATKRVVWNSTSSRYDVVPIESVVKSRFFPKCLRYSKLTHSDRVRLYSAVERFPALNFSEFKESIDLCRWHTYRNIGNASERFFAYLYEELKRDANGNLETVDNTFKRIYTTSKRVVWFSRCLRTSVDYIVRRIEDFYLKCDYENLKAMYEKQVTYMDPVSGHLLSDLVYMYPDFLQVLPFFLQTGHVPKYIRLAMESFGIDDVDGVPSPDQVPDFLQMKSNAEKIYKDTHKRQFVNAYRDGQLAVTNPKLHKIIRKYQLNLYG